MVTAGEERSGFAGGVAEALNATGRGLVQAYDASVGGLGRMLGALKGTSGVSRKTKDLFAGGFGLIKPSERKRIEGRIKEYEKRIKATYFEIGKEGSRCEDPTSALEAETVQKLIADVREYETEILRMRNRIGEIELERKEKALQRKKRKKEGKVDTVAEARVAAAVESAIQRAVRQGRFETSSEQAIFDKVANDLLDNETEIQILATAEIGKMGNEAAVPILIEAVRFDDPHLVSEVINSLINLGDSRAIPVLKEMAEHPNSRVRIGSLRGLYKLAGDEDVLPFLIEALRDKHPEVRRTACTFIGWKDYSDAVPALVQCLKDDHEKVRRATVSALANLKDESSVLPLIRMLGDKDLEVREKSYEAIRVITGEEVEFDVHRSGKELTTAIDELRNWWQEQRLGRTDVADVEETAVATGQAREASTVEEEPAPAEEREAVSEVRAGWGPGTAEETAGSEEAPEAESESERS